MRFTTIHFVRPKITLIKRNRKSGVAMNRPSWRSSKACDAWCGSWRWCRRTAPGSNRNRPHAVLLARLPVIHETEKHINRVPPPNLPTNASLSLMILTQFYSLPNYRFPVQSTVVNDHKIVLCVLKMFIVVCCLTIRRIFKDLN